MSAVLAVVLPLTLMLLFPAPERYRRLAIALTPWSGAALFLPLLTRPEVAFSWPLLGVSLRVDEVNQPLILLTAVAWNLSAWFAWNTIERDRRWFWSGWLGALSGMSLLLLAGDIASFYIGYALLTLSAYLLITHEHNPQAWRAARVYLVMAFVGEAAILSGILLLAGTIGNADFASFTGHHETLSASPARWLLLAGFAVKMGIMPLHLWLPLAHPVAPVPASAILSGVIVKAGLMGWLRFVPGLPEDPAWIGWTLIWLGLFTAFAGVVIGLTQERIKTVLAYSTISQMGLILAAFGLTILLPDQRNALLALVGFMALHHGLNKAALFLACGSSLALGRIGTVLFALPALSLSAFPFTSGYLAKNALKAAVHHTPAEILGVVLALTSTATALLLWHAWQIARHTRTRNPSLQPSWALLVLSGLVLPWIWAAGHDLIEPVKIYMLWAAVWPLILTAVIVAAAVRLNWRASGQIPEGDLVVLVEQLAGHLPRLLAQRERRHRPHSHLLDRLHQLQGFFEHHQRSVQATGLAALLLIGLLWLTLWN
ncbi:complex I subunit 5 family protein [Wenzhouxiangella limi]|uniref:NADH dehydrogenase n=1 Tax=Wenzhouxiangella limi TaxID=2707351 RepID=A0A845UWD0_9GAMM|nr:complex I subunit 5 family protein [Wenzhouxiangella limi]NDY94562.1 NADH dehydrogenase [Wenzhouxiangella limi]